jgi:hypothetical protein
MKVIICLLALYMLIVNGECEMMANKAMSQLYGNDFDSNDVAFMNNKESDESAYDQLENDKFEDDEQLFEKMRSIRSKKSMKPIVHNGYTLDINIDMFKSTVS